MPRILAPSDEGVDEMNNGGGVSDDDLWVALTGFMGTVGIVFAVFWIAGAMTAGVIAEMRGRSGFGFFFVSLFFLGPIGTGFALVAAREHRGRPVVASFEASDLLPLAPERRRFSCPRCRALNDIPNSAAAYDCWRCKEHRSVRSVDS